MTDKGSAAELRELQALIAIAQEYDFDAMLVEDGDYRVEIVRRESSSVVMDPVALPPSSGATTLPVAELVSDVVERGEQVRAPIVGVFYRAPSPSAPSFVNLGDRVSVGQTLCILEAMKLMNEITTDVAGVVTAIYPENGALVTIGQVMFEIVP